LARVATYIDGWNLYYGVKAKFGRRYLWLDLVELARQLRPRDDLITVRYFTTTVRGEPAAASNQLEYLRALEAHNRPVASAGPTLDVRRGWFKSRTIAPCRRCGQHWHCGCVPMTRFRTFEEKETDVALGAALVEDAALEIANVALLLSADSDFAPAVASAKRVLPTLSVILAMPPGNLRPHKRFRDVGYFNINETALRRSQLPERVTDPADGVVYERPAKWA
jgi:uncharacterized LabA/DUF88 family protein